MPEIFGLHYSPNIMVQIGLVLVLAFLGTKIFQRGEVGRAQLGSDPWASEGVPE